MTGGRYDPISGFPIGAICNWQIRLYEGIMGNATTSLAYDIGEEIISEKGRPSSHWSIHKGSKKVNFIN